MTTGNVFFVDSGSATGSDGATNGLNPQTPFLTIDYAIGRCTASNGDIIFVMPGHAETVAATDITIDVAGVSIIGLGHGNDRPTLTYGAAGSTVTMSAASSRLSNVILTPGAASVAAAITISGAGVEIDNVVLTPHATNEFLIGITAAATADDLIIRDCTMISLDGTGAATGIHLIGADRVQILRNHIQGDFSTGAIENTTTACKQVTIAHNIISNQSTSGVITMLTASTGTISFNAFSNRSTGVAQFTPTATLCIENYMVNDENEYGIIVPLTAST